MARQLAHRKPCSQPRGSAINLRARGYWRWQERFRDQGAAGLWRDKTPRSRLPPLSPEEVIVAVLARTGRGPWTIGRQHDQT